MNEKCYYCGSSDVVQQPKFSMGMSLSVEICADCFKKVLGEQSYKDFIANKKL